jgi:hypothetical protein
MSTSKSGTSTAPVTASNSVASTASVTVSKSDILKSTSSLSTQALPNVETQTTSLTTTSTEKTALPVEVRTEAATTKATPIVTMATFSVQQYTDRPTIRTQPTELTLPPQRIITTEPLKTTIKEKPFYPPDEPKPPVEPEPIWTENFRGQPEKPEPPAQPEPPVLPEPPERPKPPEPNPYPRRPTTRGYVNNNEISAEQNFGTERWLRLTTSKSWDPPEPYARQSDRIFRRTPMPPVRTTTRKYIDSRYDRRPINRATTKGYRGWDISDIGESITNNRGRVSPNYQKNWARTGRQNNKFNLEDDNTGFESRDDDRRPDPWGRSRGRPVTPDPARPFF